MKRFSIVLALAVVGLVGNMVEAGRIGGPGRDVAHCNAQASVWYTEVFKGGETVTIALQGDGDTDLDIYVYDMAGNVIVRGIGLTDREVVSMRVHTTGAFRIEVRNLGNVWNQFLLTTN